MSDYWKGMFATALGAILVYILLQALGTATVYFDTNRANTITGCVANGYTYGECFNVIHDRTGNDSKFTK